MCKTKDSRSEPSNSGAANVVRFPCMKEAKCSELSHWLSQRACTLFLSLRSCINISMQDLQQTQISFTGAYSGEMMTSLRRGNFIGATLSFTLSQLSLVFGLPRLCERFNPESQRDVYISTRNANPWDCFHLWR